MLKLEDNYIGHMDSFGGLELIKSNLERMHRTRFFCASGYIPFEAQDFFLASGIGLDMYFYAHIR